jgi:hypothetical protein
MRGVWDKTAAYWLKFGVGETQDENHGFCILGDFGLNKNSGIWLGTFASTGNFHSAQSSMPVIYKLVGEDTGIISRALNDFLFFLSPVQSSSSSTNRMAKEKKKEDTSLTFIGLILVLLLTCIIAVGGCCPQPTGQLT